MKQYKECGTYAGSNQHYRRGEVPCQECRKARNAYLRARRRRNGECGPAGATPDERKMGKLEPALLYEDIMAARAWDERTRSYGA